MSEGLRAQNRVVEKRTPSPHLHVSPSISSNPLCDCALSGLLSGFPTWWRLPTLLLNTLRPQPCPIVLATLNPWAHGVLSPSCYRFLILGA